MTSRLDALVLAPVDRHEDRVRDSAGRPRAAASPSGCRTCAPRSCAVDTTPRSFGPPPPTMTGLPRSSGRRAARPPRRTRRGRRGGWSGAASSALSSRRGRTAGNGLPDQGSIERQHRDAVAGVRWRRTGSSPAAATSPPGPSIGSSPLGKRCRDATAPSRYTTIEFVAGLDRPDRAGPSSTGHVRIVRSVALPIRGPAYVVRWTPPSTSKSDDPGVTRVGHGDRGAADAPMPVGSGS